MPDVVHRWYVYQTVPLSLTSNQDVHGKKEVLAHCGEVLDSAYNLLGMLTCMACIEIELERKRRRVDP